MSILACIDGLKNRLLKNSRSLKTSQLRLNMDREWSQAFRQFVWQTMNNIKSTLNSLPPQHFVIGLYLIFYLTVGFYTQLRLMETKPVPEYLLEDFGYYEQALLNTLNGEGPYTIRSIGLGYLYPPQSFFIIDVFSHIKPFLLKVSLYSVINITLLTLIIHGIARHYGYSGNKVWYWYVIGLGFAPFLELLHIGQINVFTLFGISLLFLWEDKSSILSGIGLSLAIITKVTPILFVWYLFVNRKFKVIVATVVIIALITLLNIWRYGFFPVLEYPKLFQWLVHQFPMSNNSQSFVAKVITIVNSTNFREFVSVLPVTLQIPILSISVFLTSNYQIVHRGLILYILFGIVISGLLTFYGQQPKEPLFIVTALGMMLSPNIMWYHHYVFILLPLLIWMGWSHLDRRVVTWCLIGLLIVQFDRYFPPYGFFIHIFSHLSLLAILIWQLKQFRIAIKHRKILAI